MKDWKLILFTFLVIVMILSVSGCNSAATPPPTPTQLPPTSEPTSLPEVPADTPVTFGKVDVGGYSLYLMCKGEGSPTIVMDYGLYSRGSGSGQFDKVKNSIVSTLGNRVCTYERAGNMTSDRPPSTPRTSLDMANDLRNILLNGNIPSPYIVVAGGSASFNALIFAQQYPEDIAGITLISPMHPDEVSEIVSVIQAESPSESKGISNMIEYYTSMQMDPSNTPEDWDYQSSFEQILPIDSINNLPLAVLVHSMDNPQPQIDIYRLMFGNDLPAELIQQVSEVVLPLRMQMTKLSSTSKLFTVEDCSFLIHYEKPEPVVEAIQWVLDQVSQE